MARSEKAGLILLVALLALSACAQPPRDGTARPLHDDTQNINRPDRGMRDSHTM